MSSSASRNDAVVPLEDGQSPQLSRETTILSCVDRNELFGGTIKRPGFNYYCNSDKESQAHPMIDNTNLRYLPLHLQCGVTAYCRPDVLVRCPLVLQDLNRDIQECLAILPSSTHALIRRTNLWLNTTYYYGPKACPKNVNHSTAHHHEGWLLWARDRPDKAEGIEIYNVFDYRAMRLHWNGCGLILHEFCHLIHQFCLGLDCQLVKQAYVSAMDSGLYDSTPRRDWAGNETETDMAYAMVNYKEFFAEMSVTFLADSYKELDGACKSLLDQCSPPLVAPSVVARVQSRAKRCYPVLTNITTAPLSLSKNWLNLLNVNSSFRSSTQISHCNKFYPFTKGQLKHFDPSLHDTMGFLWGEISRWIDVKDDCCCSKRRALCFPC